MNDIYDIKENLLGLPIDITNSLIFIIFLIGIYIFLKIFFKKEEKEEKIEEKPILKVEYKDYNNILNQFVSEYLDSKSHIFYSGLIVILREILEEKENKNISKMTFDEINILNIDDSIKNLIKDVYFNEYMEYLSQDSIDYRSKLVANVRGLI